jgi:hypothetical protein
MPTQQEMEDQVELHKAFIDAWEEMQRDRPATPFPAIHAGLQLAASIAIDQCGMTEADLHKNLQHWIDYVKAAAGKGPKANN